ncbi:uncharacterized protein PITG_06770 [Phytophthora infestans T30-4]|uniref:Uncharacterized protein n=1 Tax=Phytophthora infestans (strain T30-4) TaxID=403677 RepID=D0N826_PHYIT|nr:uncharacterized protein PITG_06770 [Phytophthora infestans T30-4]EEY53143.1 hypothetical protein PITG_06770 [Phytophthora infestans T30-4]|eukprot:XP_002904761.1 hypothetical protein PITG_06770 [Phytophthora infestans T30-4]
MRQAVHPMETSGDGEIRHKLHLEDDDWQDAANSFRGPSLVMMNGTLDSSAHELEEDELEGTAAGLASPKFGGGNSSNVIKTGRLLTFADETGGSLVEMTYSNRTHYSKQAGPGAVQGVTKGGCCVVQ